jgi:CheY-like chemotaxis protein
MSRKILLADDSVTIQKVIELTFMDEDYVVKAVSNGDEALAALPEIRPDFVIADVHMPGANGYEVCRRSKEMSPDVPVLLLVGTFEPFDEGQARASGADSFLKKPFDSQELLQRVQDLLASRAGTAAAAVPAAAPPPPLPDLSAAPFPQASAEPGWGSFQLEPEAPAAFSSPAPFPEAFPEQAAAPSALRESSPFLEEETPFVLEDEQAPIEFQGTEFQGTEFQETELQVEAAPPLPAGEPLFDFDSPEPASLEDTAPALSNIDLDAAPGAAPRPAAGFGAPWITDTAPEERLGVPESAVPLVDSLAETEARIEAPPPSSIAASHEPEAAWTPRETEPELWSPMIDAPPLPPTLAMTPPPLPGSFPVPPPVDAPPMPIIAPPPAAAPLAVGSVSTSTNGGGHLSEEDIDRIARRVVELMGDKAVRDVAWEVVPDLAEVVIRDRLRELESQVENPAE